MSEMVAAGTWERHNPGVPPPALPGEAAAAAAAGGEGEDEEEAAKALQSLSTSLLGSQRTGSRGEHEGREPAVSSGGKGKPRAAEAAAGSGGRPGKRAGDLVRRMISEERRQGALLAAVQAEPE